MTVYAVEFPYEGPEAIFATREAAEAALESDSRFSWSSDYYVREWTVE